MRRQDRRNYQATRISDHPKQQAVEAEVCRNMLERILDAMVVYRSALEVTLAIKDQIYIVNVQAHASDMPQLIGQGGARYYALKRIVELMGDKRGTKILLPRFLPPEAIGTVKPSPRTGDFSERVYGLIGDVVNLVFDIEMRSQVIEYRDHPKDVTVRVTVPDAVREQDGFWADVELILQAIGFVWERQIELRVVSAETKTKP